MNSRLISMNVYIQSQILNMIASVKNFTAASRMAASQDDGAVSKEEAKQLRQIEKAAERFIAELEKIK